MKTLLFDSETTGLDPSKNHIIEIGAQLVDQEWNILGELSLLVKNPNVTEITSETTALTGIKQEDIDAQGVEIQDAISQLGALASGADYICAYNRDFDEAFLRAEIARHALGMIPVVNAMAQLPWICAMKDLEKNYGQKCWKLSHLALDYGVSVDPACLHRAVNDVDLMRRMLKQLGVTAYSMWEFQQIPWMYIAALIPAPWTDGGKGKDEAVKLGFSWERAKGDEKRFEKTWIKKIKAHKLDDEIKNATFKIQQMGA